MRELTLKDFYIELETDPDLRRLGKYKVIPNVGSEIFPIDIDLSGKKLFLGDGDFSDSFVAFCDTKVETIDFGTSRFTQFYLDYMKATTIDFNCARASSIMFDRAVFENCYLNKFDVGELYFNESRAKNIYVQDLNAGRIFLEKLIATTVNLGNRSTSDLKILTDTTGVQTFGDKEIPKIDREGAFDITEPKKLTADEFLEFIKGGYDLNNLGKYTITPSDGNKILSISTIGKIVNLGKGDFSQVDVEFKDVSTTQINLNSSTFKSLVFTNCTSMSLELNDAGITKLTLSNSNIDSFFCERSKIVDCNIDNTSINRFFLTKLSCDNLRFDSSHIEEVYASSAVHQNIALNNCTVKVFNAHEAKFDTIDFGNSHIDRVLMRAASVKLINAKNLVARLFLIGYYDNDIQELQVSEATTGTKEGIETLVFKKIVPNELDREKVESARQQQIPKVFTMN